MQSQHRMLSKVIAAVGFSALMVAQLSAEEIAVGNYGIAANGMPFAVALAKDFFKEEGANVTGIISSQGGGTSVRNMLAGGVAYGEANPGATAVADPAGRRPQDRQRQRADHRRVRLGGEAGLADQDDQGPQGQEDRLHQSALDQPGARASCCCRRPATRPRTPSSSRPAASARASPRSISARSTSRRSPSRCGRRTRTNTALSPSQATSCRRSTTSSA